MKHLFIINPKAGKEDSTQKLKEKIDVLAKKYALDHKIMLTKYAGHATELVHEYVSDGEEWRVYACGGDGTLNEVVNGVAEYSNAAVTVFPCGTGNDFVKTFGNMTGRFYSLEELILGEERELDLMCCAGRYAINICSVGFDARAAHDVHKFSKWPGVKPYAAFSLSAAYNVILGMTENYKVKMNINSVNYMV